MHPGRHPWRPAALLTLCLALTACGGGDYEPSPEPDASPFTPGAGDLPHPANLYPYSAVSLLTFGLQYQSTTAPAAPNWYLVDANTCVDNLPGPPASYPGGKVTLDTVNLDVNKTDACTPEIKVKATTDDGLVAAADAKMRLRGSSTRFATLKSYRVKFSGAGSWHGEETLNLNKHPYDLTRVRNKLAFDLMRRVPYHESLRTQFVKINYDAGSGAQSMGLFTHVEKLGGSSFLARRGWVAGSNVYKVADFSFNQDSRLTAPGGTPGPSFEEMLEIESDSGQHQTIVAAVDALADDNIPFAQTFTRYFDRNNYLTWLATTTLLGNWDTTTQNFGLYQPLGSEKFYFLPWDYDAALGFPQQPGATVYPPWDNGISTWWDSALHRRFMREPGNLDLLKAAVQQIRAQYLTDAAVKALLDSYRPIVQPVIASAPDVTNLETHGPAAAMDQWAAEYARLETVIAYNHNLFLQSLERPMPFWLAGSDVAGHLLLDWGWPEPFHPKGKPISYRIEVARAQAGTPAFHASTMIGTFTAVPGTTTRDVGALAAGSYLLRVTASDPDGNSTLAFDEVTFDGNQLFGTICLTMPGAATCPP